jgi:hypothetical protein
VFSWHPPNPDSSVVLPDGEAWLITPENAFTLFQSPMAASFTPLQLTLGIAHEDLRLVCGCSAMKTHFMKLPTNSSYADIASRGSLELGSVATDDRRFCASVLGGPILWACVAYHFAADPSLLLDISTSQYEHLQLTGAALVGQKFDELTCWKGVILWWGHVESHWALP